jgi:DnaJ family protein C protein 22
VFCFHLQTENLEAVTAHIHPLLLMHIFSNFFLNWGYSNFFLSVGIWTVGNIGREEGTIYWALYGAYATFPLYWYLEDDSTWYTLMTFFSALAFDLKSKKWRRKPKKQKSLLK